MKPYMIVPLLVLLVSGPAYCADEATAEPPAIKKLRATLATMLPGVEFSKIVESPIPGVFALFSGMNIAYVSADGQYLLQGDLVDMSRRVNLTRQDRGALQLAALEEMGEEHMVIYPATAGPGLNTAGGVRTITVITDSTCPYCRKLHSEIDELLSQGVRVRYLLYPRAGLGSPAYRELQSIWCADNQQEAMTRAKSGQKIAATSCANPIEEHMAFARRVGLEGTPMIFLDNGLVISGYRPAQELLQLLQRAPKIQ